MARSKGKSYYTPLTPSQRLAQRYKKGMPVHMLLRYLHRQTQTPLEIQEMVMVAATLEEAVTPLRTLARPSGPLLEGYSRGVKGSRTLARTLKTVGADTDEFLGKLREAIGSILKKRQLL